MGIILTFMNADHAKLDRMLDDFLAAEINSGKAKKYFADFHDYIRLHIKLEDTVLFPRFDAYMGMTEGIGPTIVARRDHGNIIKLLLDLRKHSEADDKEKIQYVSLHLHRVMKKHHDREKEIQYPLTDMLIEPAEWQRILQEIYGDKLDFTGR